MTEDREFVKGSEGHLKRATNILYKLGIPMLRSLQDQEGIFCIEYPKWFLIANGYIYQNTWISAQREIILRAKRYHKRLVVYVAKDDMFLIFYPQDILNDHWENKRGYLRMCNWNYTVGQEIFIERQKNV